MNHFLQRINGRYVFKEEIKERIKDNDNEELKSRIHIHNGWKYSDHDGLTLLHLCATYENVELAKYLVGKVPDIEARTKSGLTALSLAIACSCFEVAEVLLEKGAQVYTQTHPNDSALRMAVMHSMSLPTHMFKLLYNSLKQTCTTRELCEILRKVECKLDSVVAMQNSVLTRLVLTARSVIPRTESYDSVRVAVALADTSNLRILMNEGVDSSQRTYAFFGRLVELTTAPKKDLTAVRTFVDFLANWNGWALYPMDCVKKIFERADESVLKIFMEYEIHVITKRKSHIDLLAHLYANRNAGVAALIKRLLAKDHPIGFGAYGKPGLHHAVRECAIENVKAHLEMNGSPDSVDLSGRPALFEAFKSTQNYAAKEKCVLMLLFGGADVQITDSKGVSVFNFFRDIDSRQLIQLVLAHLAMKESLGLTIRKGIYNRISKNEFLLSCYTQFREHLDLMKMYMVSANLTAYTCLTQPAATILKYLTDETMMRMPAHRIFAANINPYYEALFDKLLDEIKIHRSKTVFRKDSKGGPGFSGRRPLGT